MVFWQKEADKVTGGRVWPIIGWTSQLLALSWVSCHLEDVPLAYLIFLGEKILLLFTLKSQCGRCLHFPKQRKRYLKILHLFPYVTFDILLVISKYQFRDTVLPDFQVN